jgi:signal transduction histidine kinase
VGNQADVLARSHTGESRWQWAWDSLAAAAFMIAFTAAGNVLIRSTGAQYPITSSRLALPWIPLGIAVGVVMMRGASRWPGPFVGTLVAQLFVLHQSPVFSALQAVAFVLAALGIRALLRAWRFNAQLERWRDPVLLWVAAGTGAAVLACCALGALLASAALEPARLNSGLALVIIGSGARPQLTNAALMTALRWWANWTAGVALVVPSIYALGGSIWREIGRRWGELSIILVVLAGWSIVSLTATPWAIRLPLGLVAVLIVTWSAIRFGAPLAGVVTLVLAFVESGAFMAGLGPLQSRADEAIGDVWTFITTLSLLGTLITALLAERDAASRRQAASEARYRALFDSNPRPLWVHDPQTLRILIANQAAVRHYGYTREAFTQLRLTDLDVGTAPGAPGGGNTLGALESGEHVHRTRDGTVIAVELHAAPIEYEGRPARLVFSDDVTDRNRLRGALLDAGDRAGRELGQELHDGLGQELVALSLLARSERTRIQSGRAADVEKLDLIESITIRALDTCRNVARGLSALAETGGDLQGALERLPTRFRHDGPPVIRVTIADDATLTLPIATRDHLYRIAQEALTNAVKHAHARNIDIRLEIAPSAVRLSVRDDGVGLPGGTTPAQGLGRASMRHRAAAIGARMYVTGAAGGGTELRLECPQTAATAGYGG